METKVTKKYNKMVSCAKKLIKTPDALVQATMRAFYAKQKINFAWPKFQICFLT